MDNFLTMQFFFCQIKNDRAGAFWGGDEHLVIKFLWPKSMGVNDPRGMANLDPRGISYHHNQIFD